MDSDIGPANTRGIPILTPMDTPEGTESTDEPTTDGPGTETVEVGDATPEPAADVPKERSVPGWAIGLYVLVALAIGLQLALGWVLLDNSEELYEVSAQNNDLVLRTAGIRDDVADLSEELAALDRRVTNAQSVSVVGEGVAPTNEGLPLIPSSGADPAVGMALPTITGPDHDSGRELTIGSGGLATVTIVWAHWCPYCQQELPMVDALLKDGSLDQFDAVQVQSITTFIDEDRPNPLDPYMDQLQLAYPVVVDETGAYAAQLGIQGVPAWVISDQDGNILGRFSGAIGEEAFLGVMEEVQRIATEGGA